MNVTFKQLRALRAVAQTRNFTAAAKRLHTTQSALSASIKELERALGMKLIDRNTRRFALTAAGEEFLPAAVRILGDLQTSINNLTTLAALKRGSVILGCAPSIASTLLAKPIASFHARYPLVTIILKDDLAEQSFSKLRSGEIEMAIGTLLEPQPDLAADPLLSDRLVAVAHADFAPAKKKTIPWRALTEWPIVAPSENSAMRNFIESNFVKSTNTPFQPVFEAAHWMTMIAMVEAGLGVVITASHALKYLPRKHLRVIDLVQPTVTRDISVIRHRDRMLSPAATAFVEHLKAEPAFSSAGPSFE
jgi:DNA-binding transcriptional LysR family regulator